MRIFRPRGRRPRLPFGLLGMFVLLGIGERYVRRHDSTFLGVVSWEWRCADSAAGRQAVGAEVLGFGDSLLKLSTIPAVIAERTGLSGYNLAVSGGQPPSSESLLRHALDAGARPRLILFECAPKLLQLPPSHNAENWPHLLSISEAADLAIRSWNPGELAATVASKALAAVSCREGLREAIRLALAGEPNRHRIGVMTARMAWRRDLGAQLSPADRWRIEAPVDVEAWRAGFYPRWEVHPTNLDSLRRFLDLAESRSIPVLWVVPPILPALQDANDASGFTASQDEFLGDFQTRYPGVRIVDGRGLRYPEADFLDPNHLNAAGAVAFSRTLADAIAQPPADISAWVRLDSSSEAEIATRPVESPR